MFIYIYIYDVIVMIGNVWVTPARRLAFRSVTSRLSVARTCSQHRVAGGDAVSGLKQRDLKDSGKACRSKESSSSMEMEPMYFVASSVSGLWTVS